MLHKWCHHKFAYCKLRLYTSPSSTNSSLFIKSMNAVPGVAKPNRKPGGEEGGGEGEGRG